VFFLICLIFLLLRRLPYPALLYLCYSHVGAKNGPELIDGAENEEKKIDVKFMKAFLKCLKMNFTEALPWFQAKIYLSVVLLPFFFLSVFRLTTEALWLVGRQIQS
jgi:hypothetical protein